MTPPPWTTPPTIGQPRRRLVGALATLSAVLAIVAVILSIVALTKAETRPSYSATEHAAARSDLCQRFKPAMNAIHIETHGSDPGFGRTALLNGALILERSAANPALESKYRDAALAVSSAYENLAIASTSGQSGDPQFESVVGAANTVERSLKDLCGD